MLAREPLAGNMDLAVAHLGHRVAARFVLIAAKKRVGRKLAFGEQLQLVPAHDFDLAPGKILKGIASVEGDMLCYRFPETLMGRKLCGPVYKNPDGTPDDRNEYVAADVFDVHQFSLKQ